MCLLRGCAAQVKNQERKLIFWRQQGEISVELLTILIEVLHGVPQCLDINAGTVPVSAITTYL
jgi:hypothetical protein